MHPERSMNRGSRNWDVPGDEAAESRQRPHSSGYVSAFKLHGEEVGRSKSPVHRWAL